MPPTKSILLIISLFLSNIPYSSAHIVPSQGEEVIVYGLPFDFDEYSIYTAKMYQSKQWMRAVYSSLIKRSSGTFLPWTADLANSMPLVSSDGLTYTFELKDGLLFSIGEPLTVDDVEFSLKVALTPAINIASYSSYAGFLDNNSMTIVSENNFTITMNSPHAFPYDLLSFPIIPEQYFKEKYKDCLDGVKADCTWNSIDGSDAISAGPFMLTDIDEVNEIITIEANPFWYDANYVRTDKIIFQTIEEKSDAISSLMDGSIHLLDARYNTRITELEGTDEISESFVNAPVSYEFFLNHKHSWLGTGEQINIMNGISGNNFTASKLLRKAISHVVDRDTFVTELLEDIAVPATTGMPTTALGYNASLQPDVYDIPMAKEIMEDLGFDFSMLDEPDSSGLYSKYFFSISIIYPNWFDYVSDMVNDFTVQLQKIGVGVSTLGSSDSFEINQILNSNINPRVYDEGGFDILIYWNEWGIDWNPTSHYDGSGSCQTGNCLNFYNFDLEENISPISLAVDDYLKQIDFDKRYEKVSYLQELLHEWLPTIPIIYPIYHWGWSADVNGIDTRLISQSVPDWWQIYRTGFEKNTEPETYCDCAPSNDYQNILLVFSFIGFFIVIPIISGSIIKTRRKSKNKRSKNPSGYLTWDEEKINVSLLCIACESPNFDTNYYCQDCGTRLRG